MKSEVGQKKKSGKLRLNLLDWIIIAALLLSAVGVWFRYGFSENWKNKKNLVTAQISFSVSDIKETTYTGGYFREGTQVFNADNDNTLIGVFAGEDKFSYIPAKYYVTTKTGETIIKQSVTDRIDVTGAIISEGIKNENGFFYGGSTYIAPGQIVIICSQDLKLMVLITDIQILESEK